MLNSMGLGFVFTARDMASAKMQRLERRFTTLDQRVTGGTNRMTSAFQQLGVGLAVFSAGAATVAGALALANAAGRFEQGLAAIGSVTRATTHQLQQLREAAIQAGIETQFSPTEAIEGLTSLAAAGQTAEQATRTLIPVLDLAAGSLGQLGVAQAAEAVVGTLNAYGMTADRAAGVTDRLLRITQLTNFQTRDFEAGLAKAAAAGSVFNQSLDDVLITMGLLRNRNIDASSAATAFREATRRVGADQRAQQAISGAGVQVFDALLPENLERLSRQPLSTEVRTPDAFEEVGRTRSTAHRAEAATSAMPARTEATGRMDEFAQLERNMMAFANAQARRQGQAPPFQINVQVDGETIARATHTANSDAAARSFSPVPSY